MHSFSHYFSSHSGVGNKCRRNKSNSFGNSFSLPRYLIWLTNSYDRQHIRTAFCAVLLLITDASVFCFVEPSWKCDWRTCTYSTICVWRLAKFAEAWTSAFLPVPNLTGPPGFHVEITNVSQSVNSYPSLASWAKLPWPHWSLSKPNLYPGADDHRCPIAYGLASWSNDNFRRETQFLFAINSFLMVFSA